MPRDFENLFNIGDMGDQEIEDLIAQQLREYPDVDVDDIDIRVERGFVTVGGRVGTEHEMQVVSQVITDVLGIHDYSNEIVVDETRRTLLPEAADEEVALDNETDAPMGGAADQTSDTADHMLEHLEEELYGTHDLGKAIQDGLDYEAPDRPLQEGTWSEENH